MANALALAAVAGALNALQPGHVVRNGVLGRYDGVRFVETAFGPRPPKRVRVSRPYPENGPREVARRVRQIAACTLTWSNGLRSM